MSAATPELEQPMAALGRPRLGADVVQLYLATFPLVVSLLMFAFQLHDRPWIITISTIGALSVIGGLMRTRRQLFKTADIGLLVLQGATFFWFFWPGWTASLTPGQFKGHAALISIDNHTGVIAYVAVSAFYFMLTLTYQLTNMPRLSKAVSKLWGRRPAAPSGRAVLLLAFAIAAGFSFYILVSGGVGAAIENIAGGRSAHTPWDSEGNYGSSLSSLHFLVSAVMVASSATAIYLVLTGRVKGLTAGFLGMTALIAVTSLAIESGTRSTLAQCILPPMVLYYRKTRLEGRQLRPGAMAVIAVLALSALALANFQLQHRTSGRFDQEVDFELKHNDFMTHTAFAFASMEKEEDFTYDSPLLHIISGPIPRVLWRGKPEIEAMNVFSWYMWGVDVKKTGGNNLPGIVGQYYMSWGWFGVLEIGFWLGLLVRLGDNAVRDLHPRSMGFIAYAVALSYFFVAFRMIGFFYFFPVVTSLIIARLLSRRPKGQRASKAAAIAGAASR